jgi:hypothetical protein
MPLMAPMGSRASRDGEVASRWDGYHARTVGRGPRPLLLRACELLGPGAGRMAVDLGCGAGAESRAAFWPGAGDACDPGAGQLASVSRGRRRLVSWAGLMVTGNGRSTVKEAVVTATAA